MRSLNERFLFNPAEEILLDQPSSYGFEITVNAIVSDPIDVDADDFVDVVLIDAVSSALGALHGRAHFTKFRYSFNDLSCGPVSNLPSSAVSTGDINNDGFGGIVLSGTDAVYGLTVAAS